MDFGGCLQLFAITYTAEINTFVNTLIYIQGNIWLFSFGPCVVYEGHLTISMFTWSSTQEGFLTPFPNVYI